MNRDHDHDIADLLVRQHNMMRAEDKKSHILKRLIDEGYEVMDCRLIDVGTYEDLIGMARVILEEETDAKIHRNGISEDRHSELLRLGQGDLDRPNSMDGKASRDPGDLG